jgi:hypothetical protein
MEQTPNVNTNNENELNIKNNNSNPDKMTDVIDEPADLFFGGVFTDDFLDSLAVVDAWDPDADDSYESDAETGRSSENKKTHGDETISKDSEIKSKCDRSGDHGSRSDSRRRDRASVETKHNSKDKTAHRKDEGDTDEQKHSADKDKQEGYEKTRGRSRERGKETSRDNKEKNTSRTIRGSRDHMERSVHRRDRNGKDRSAERSMFSYSSNRENKDESMERSVDRKQREKNIERSVQIDDKDKNIMRTSNRYSYQYRVNNKERTADVSAKERNCDLRHSVSNAHARGIAEAVHKRQENSKEVNRRDDGSNESQRNEKNPNLNLDNGESHRESIKNYHLEKGTSDVLKHVSENRMTEIVAVSQQHMITKCNNPPLNNIKLDTCIKELADVVPPGTENDFIISTKDESVKMVEDIKNGCITGAKEKPETKKPDVLGSEKSCKHPMVKSESQDKETCIICEKNDEQKMLERNDSEKASLYTAGQQPHREPRRVDSPHERKRMRSDSKRSVGRSSASRSTRHGHLDEGRRRKRLRNSSEENKRHSSSLERMFEASRMRNEQFNEMLRKKRLLASHREENFRRSRSRERWQHHSDLNRSKIKDDENDSRQSQPGNVVKQHELYEGQERLGRSSSWDKHYRRTLNDIRRSECGSRGKQRELSVGRERLRRSASRDRHLKRASSAERWQPSIDAQRSNRKMDAHYNSRRSVRSLSREKQSESFLPVRISRSRSQDREHRNEYRDRQERSRKSLSPEGHMPLSPNMSFELSSISSDREPKRRSSHSLSRERRSREYQRSHRDSFSCLSSGSAFSCSDSFVSLSSVSDDSKYRRQRRKRSPFWKELERQFTKDLCKSYYNQSAEYSSGAGTAHYEVQLKLIFFLILVVYMYMLFS